MSAVRNNIPVIINGKCVIRSAADFIGEWGEAEGSNWIFPYNVIHLSHIIWGSLSEKTGRERRTVRKRRCESER